MKTPSVESVQRSRLLPRISFRTMFVVTTMAAIIAAIGRAAGNGGSLAIAFLISLGFFVACMAAFVVLFTVAWLFSRIWYEPTDETLQGSPFAADQLPPQILPPRDPTS